MAKSFERVVSVISKKPHLRQDFEVQGLLPWLRKKSQLFSQLKTDFLKDIVKNCGLATFNRDDVIIKQGERGDCFYIILEGRISIHIINKDRDDGSEDRSPFADIGARDQDGNLDRSKLGNFVTCLGSGVPFGEVALLSDDCTRNASIIAEEKTDLLVVDRALYNRAVRDVLAREFEEKRDFIKNNPLFANWVPKYRNQLAMAMYKESFPYDAVLVKQGEPVTNIYFLIRGEVEVRTDRALHQTQYPWLYKLLEDEREKLIKEKKLRPPPDSHVTQPLKKRESSKSAKLCYLGINETIGEIEVLLDMGTYLQTAVCSERTDVLVLEMKHYERLFVRRHQRTIDTMRQDLEVRLETRTALLADKVEVEILKLVQMKLKMVNNPSAAPSEKKKKSVTSVHAAERQFLNHKGPLLDPYGPGSVFYVIRLREKSKLRLKAHQDRKSTKPAQTVGHIHTIRLPQTLVAAAHLAGGQETTDPGASAGDADRDALPLHRDSGDFKRVQSAHSKSPRQNGPLSFRQIQSATKTRSQVKNNERPGPAAENMSHDTEVSRSYPRSSSDYTTVEQEATLGVLESKVKEWLHKGNPRSRSNVTKLRRLPVENLEPKPRPGNRVVVRKRHKSNHSDTSGTGNDDRSNTDTEGYSMSKAASDPEPLERFRILLTN